MRPASDNCEGCHWPAMRHSDTVRSKFRYADDAKSTETRYKLTLHTGAGEAREGASKGIHWHIAQQMMFTAIDSKAQRIPLVQVKGADGKTRTWFDATAGCRGRQRRSCRCAASNAPIATTPPVTRSPIPADMVDEAIQEGRSTAACRRSRRGRWPSSTRRRLTQSTVPTSSVA